jgi:hypothetical protein
MIKTFKIKLVSPKYDNNNKEMQISIFISYYYYIRGGELEEGRSE